MKEKFLSGRFILCCITGIVFAVMSIMGKLPTDKISEIILIVIYAYFTRNRNGESGGK